MGTSLSLCRCLALIAVACHAATAFAQPASAPAQVAPAVPAPAPQSASAEGEPVSAAPATTASNAATAPTTETPALAVDVSTSTSATAALDDEAPPSAEEEPQTEAAAPLMHWIASLGIGVPVRLSKEKELGQERVAPVFLDGFGGIVFPTGSFVQHGLGLGVSIGMSEDGGFYEPTPAGSQAALMPAYVAYLPMGADLWVLGHLGVPLLIAGGTSAGLELAATLGYRLLAGFGAYTELGVSGFAGAESRVNVLGSLEVGLFVDYEVLP